MEKPLRILHLEDDPDDAELARAALAEAGVECAVTLARSGAEFAAALENGRFDLILSDFMIPGFGGASALQLAREKRPDVPFLFLSGHIGEDAAAEALRGGATDCLLKDAPRRFAPAVRRAVREAAEREGRAQAEKSLRESEEQYRRLVESSPEADA